MSRAARRAAAALPAAVMLSAAVLLPAASRAGEFRSIATASILYDAPSPQAKKLFVAPRGMPVEVVSTIRLWVKVRDASGDLAWVERDALSPQRTVLAVAAPAAAVRVAAADGAAVVFQAERGVVLELLEPAPAPGWVRVRHADGASGFVRAVDVWGL